jgi:dynein assembly factor 3, axonemal
MSAAQLLVGLGQYSFWGSSATFDFLDAMKDHLIDEIDGDSSRPIRILLVHAADIRHIITTIANKFRKNTSRPIEFYMLDSPIEVLARNILMLEIIHDFDIPIRQRSNILLEIYGNAKVQERTSKYIEELAAQLRNLVATGKGRLENLIDFSMMKYKEKDMLEECFKSYIASSFPFDIEHYRDYRLRSYYGDRYDSREAIADWDYHEAIRSRASIIHIRQYKDWRNTGIAFEFGDQQYSCPNRTLMAYAEGYIKLGKDKGLKKEVKGYWGDMINSPYFSFGVDCETTNAHAAGLFEIVNKNTGSEQHRHHTVEVALFNILASLYQIESREVYQMKSAHDIFSGLGEQSSGSADIHEKATIVELEDEDEEHLPATEAASECQIESDEENKMKQRAINIFETFQNIKVRFSVYLLIALDLNAVILSLIRSSQCLVRLMRSSINQNTMDISTQHSSQRSQHSY